MLYGRWKELLETVNTQDEEFQWTNKELQEVIKTIEWDLQDLEETIHILTNIPLSAHFLMEHYYPSLSTQRAAERKTKVRIDDTELNSRRKFIKDSRDGLDAMKQHMQNKETRGKMERDQREVC